MAKFPINYSEATPSGRSPNVRANINTDTGGEAIAQGIMNIGKVVGGIEEDIRKAQDAAELSTIDRLQSENWNAEYNTLLTTQDPEQRLQIHQKAVQDREKITTSSKRTNVVNAARIKLNNDEPQYAMHFSGLDRQMKIKSAGDELKFNGEKALSEGDLNTFYKLNETAFSTQLIGKAEYEKNKTEAPINAKLMQLGKLAVTNPVLVETEFNKVDFANATPDQMKLREGVIRDITSYKKELSAQVDNNINGEMIRLDNTKDLSQKDFDVAAVNMKTSILSASIDNVHKKKLLEDLVKWQNGTGEVDFPQLLALQQEMDVAQRTGIVDPTIKDRINQANISGAFGGRTKGGVQRYSTAIRRFENLKFDERLQAIEQTGVVKDFEKSNVGEGERILLFHEAMNKTLADNPNATVKELYIKIKGIADTYEMMRPNEVEARVGNKPIPPENPYKKLYPDAYYKNGEWRVKKKGKEYRIKP
jgi:hypothetical protein